MIHSRIIFLDETGGALESWPGAPYRLVFPFICGDLYGPPTTGDFLQPTIAASGRFELDLNAAQPALLASLEPTEFNRITLRIDPPQARVARLAPMALQADGIEPVGRAEWLDLQRHQELLLLYLDRPATITGESSTKGGSPTYDIRTTSAGYVWVGEQISPAGSVYRVVSAPTDPVLAIIHK